MCVRLLDFVYRSNNYSNETLSSIKAFEIEFYKNNVKSKFLRRSKENLSSTKKKQFCFLCL